jgi:lipoyl(octanoyl) transferase
MGINADLGRLPGGCCLPIVRTLGRVDYATTLEAMRQFTNKRHAQTPDEIWLCEHVGVYTQGVAGRAEHVLDAGSIPIITSNRGGQVTYHGPGQVVAYPLIDLKRLSLHVKEYVYRLEQALIKTLATFCVTAHRVAGAPGVYVQLDNPFGHSARMGPHQSRFEGLGKIAALGIKVSRHCAYHGLALNVAMDLSPFTRINPCGYAGLATVDLAVLGVEVGWQQVAQCLADALSVQLCL